MEIVWSPFHDNEFILYGNNILLYRIISIENNRNRIDNNLFLNDTSYAKLIGSINNYQNSKVVSWYPGLDIDIYTMAMHEQNQNQVKLLSLSSFNNAELSNQTDELKILEMEHPKKSNQLKWNPIKFNYLGMACDKSNDSSSILIWDLHNFSTNKPVFELNEFNSCPSICWYPDRSDILLASSLANYISLFDLRASTSPIETINTEFIRGIEIDAKNTYRAISYDHNKIAIWDLRKFNENQRAIAGLSEEFKEIKKIQFCPAKSDRFAVLTENSTQVNVYRFEEQNNNLSRETIRYQKYSQNSATINSFCWHSKDYNRLLVSLNTYNGLMDLVVADYCPIDFSINEKLNVCSNENISIYSLLQSEQLDAYQHTMDIGEKMKIRALKSYGVQEDFLNNLEMISNENKQENDLRYLWHWFDLTNKIYDRTVPYLEKYIGIKTIISMIAHNNVENTTYPQTQNEIYRNYILKMCGWNNLKELVDQLEAKKEYERAACICVFNKNMEKAIELLITASKSSNLNEYLALSLALNFVHYENKDSHRVLSKLTNPYLKALFSYKINSENFDNQIYCDSSILIPDRIGMALNIYKIDKLTDFVNRLALDCIKHGNLYGILLTGLNSECIELFQAYIHRTSDVQTAAVAIIHSTCIKTISNKYVNAWVESYRDLLDRWMLWEQRAKYDICRLEMQKKEVKLEPRVNIRCGYCAENISTKRKFKNAHENSSNIGMTCQACQKPSLRCSVCNLYMTVDPPRSAVTEDRDKMSFWFVFCQKCSHGGHLDHLVGWLKTNPECPVMNCQCLCYISEGILDE